MMPKGNAHALLQEIGYRQAFQGDIIVTPQQSLYVVSQRLTIGSWTHRAHTHDDIDQFVRILLRKSEKQVAQILLYVRGKVSHDAEIYEAYLVVADEDIGRVRISVKHPLIKDHCEINPSDLLSDDA